MSERAHGAGGSSTESAFPAGYAIAETVAAGIFLALAVGALLMARRSPDRPADQPEPTSDAEIAA